MSTVAEIIFQVEPCAETGGYVARSDAQRGGGGITTQGDSFAELDAMIADAVGGYFEPKQRPKRIRLHFSQDQIVALRPVRVSSDDYAWREYGATPAELARFEKRVERQISKERKRGRIKRFSGNLEKDLVD
jgi:predicted RNase H-like HicB family nuclease